MQLSEPAALPFLPSAGLGSRGRRGGGCWGCRFVQLPAGASRKHLRSQPYGNDPPGPIAQALGARLQQTTSPGPKQRRRRRRGKVTGTRPNTGWDRLLVARSTRLSWAERPCMELPQTEMP